MRAPKPEEPILSYLFAKPVTSSSAASDDPPPTKNHADSDNTASNSMDDRTETKDAQQSASASAPASKATSPSSALEAPPAPEEETEHYASSALVFLQSDGTVLVSKEPGLPFPTASLTRIAVCLAVIEHWDSPSTPVTLDYLDYIGLNGNVPLAGFTVGDTFTQKELMQTVLLTGGAEAAAALARSVFGTESAMLDAMNEKAVVLNLNNTTFTDIYGSAWSENTSTPEELGVLLLHGLQNKTFREAFFLETQTTNPTAQELKGMTLTRTPSLTEFDSLPIKAGVVDYSIEESCFAALILTHNAQEVLAIVVGTSAAQIVQDIHTVLKT